MWQIDNRRRIMWVASAARVGCFKVGLIHEPIFAGYVDDRERLWGAKCLTIGTRGGCLSLLLTVCLCQTVPCRRFPGNAMQYSQASRL